MVYVFGINVQLMEALFAIAVLNLIGLVLLIIEIFRLRRHLYKK